MTRIMFWNVQQFSVNKIANPLGIAFAGGGGVNAPADRLALMIELIQQANPEILVIVELRTGPTAAGTIVTGNGVIATSRLLAAMVNQHQGDWCLVPPLCTSDYEGVAVFYRSANLVFTGPHVWSGGAGGQAVAPAAGFAGAPYGWPMEFLIGQGQVPLASRHNPGLPESHCAAQTTGWTALPAPPPAAPPAPAFDPREPYRTTFAEVVGAAFVRDIELISIHAPPENLAAEGFMQEMAACDEIVGHPPPHPAPYVRVIAGDFNVNLLDPVGNIAPPYQALTEPPHNFLLGQEPAALPPGGFPPAGPGYYATLIKRPANARFWPPGTHYPGYGYIGEQNGVALYAIDNMFIRGGAPAEFTILNPVVGSPYNEFLPPVGYGVWVGAIPVARSAGLPPPGIGLLPNPAVAVNIGQIALFRGWQNYGKISSTSDHLPIVMDV